MAEEKLGESRPVRLWATDDAGIAELAKILRMSQQEVIRRIIAAGLEAIKENNYRITLPFKLRVERDPPASFVEDERTSYRTKRKG